MTLTLAQLDTMPEAEAAFKLAACCGSSRWVAGMVSLRPFTSREKLLAAADDVSRTLHPTDWLEAFEHHPRIGERQAGAMVSATAADWSSGEQSASSRATGDTRAALVEANAEYEKKFGFIFIICANGRNASEILVALRDRLSNEPDAEIFIAAREQQQITRLRLEKLVPVNRVPGGARP
ncbi:MAG: 2-oxo-4-hydroxy-4-carboxy-5-ureidoimidazoline decarboxylase [Gemmatimonadaceae bacterium]